MTPIVEAAAKAQVSVEAARAWCKDGRVKAVKGRTGWDVDLVSLQAHMDLTEAVVAAFLRIGGQEWRRYTRHRVYFEPEHWQDWSGLVFTVHDGGRPNTAALDGRPVVDSNGGTGKLTWAIKNRIYFDAVDSVLVLPGTPELAWHLPAFWGDGDRAEIVIDLADRIAAGVAARTGLDFGTPHSIKIGRGSYDLALAIPVSASPLEGA